MLALTDRAFVNVNNSSISLVFTDPGARSPCVPRYEHYVARKIYVPFMPSVAHVQARQAFSRVRELVRHMQQGVFHEGERDEMLRVCDLMSHVVFTVAVADSAKSAAASLARAGISGAPVRDELGTLVGIVSLADLTNSKLEGKRRHPTVSDVTPPDLLGVYATSPLWRPLWRWPTTTFIG